MTVVAPEKGGLGTILVNGQKVAEARIDQTQCCMFSLDEAAMSVATRARQ